MAAIRSRYDALHEEVLVRARYEQYHRGSAAPAIGMDDSKRPKGSPLLEHLRKRSGASDVVLVGFVGSFLTSAASTFAHWLLLGAATRTLLRLVVHFGISYAAAGLVVLLVFPSLMPLVAEWVRGRNHR